MKMRVRRDGFEQIIDGQGFTVRSSTPWRLKCCRCGLVHRVALVARRSWIGVAMARERAR